MGPLCGIRIIELAGLGPGPYCGMMLADMGAEVIRVERKAAPNDSPASRDPTLRSRKSVALNLKHPLGVDALLRLVDGADAMYEGFRPGVVERLDRPGCVSRPQSETGLWPHDRLGTIRTAGAGGRS